MKAVLQGCLAGALAAIIATSAQAQESKSATLAKQLVAALEAAKLDSMAAKDPSAKDLYFGALYIPGFQLLVVSGTYSVPILLDTRILDIAAEVHGAGGLLYYDGANLNAVMGRARPGDMGFDIVHVNVHKTLSTPHGGGGPGAGPVAVA